MINKDALTYILGIAAGRKVIWDLLAGAGLYSSSFNPDQRMTDFSLGSQNVGLALYADCLEASPDHTALMIKEQGQYDNLASKSGSTGNDDSTRSAASDNPASDDDGLSLGFNRFGRD